ncbi:YbaY family lipoprotein [Occultella gossypii]|uniref:YbaY family lipoprotein n=1 Tax=Occultella gossypii TaxID=2800820 RepID=A0ABS7S6P2_9MICO|nr:YbaY family lipoprotein [Occultella gossypii]MBZ2196024.1 YbaY family lipoprotein [Occultella gossypii]
MASNIVSVNGTVGIRERIALPEGSVFTVKLVAHDGEVLAGAAFDAGVGDADFTLTVDAADAPNRKKLGLWAKLTSSAGTWGTPELVHVYEPLTDLLLVRVEN